VTGPGVPAGAHVDAIAENIDLCPTFTELAGMTSASTIDGRSLVPVLHGDKPADSRSVALVEHRGPVRESTDPDLPAPRSGNPPTYEALRSAGWLYVEYVNGDREYHDLERDPSELANTFASLPPERKAVLHTMLDAMQNCRGRADCAAAERFDARSAAPASAR